ncbi:MAG: helix-turn-helix domain-containing protein [Pseudomonas sp.]
MSTKGFDAILRRLKQITVTKTDAELSTVLNVSPQTLSSWKARNSVPYSFCIDLAERHGVALDWLFLGNGPQQRTVHAAPLSSEQPLQEWETQLLARLRTLSLQDQQAIAQAVEEKQRINMLERQVEEMSRLLHAAR